MAKSGKSKAELKSEIRYLNRYHIGNTIAAVLTSFFKYGSYAVIAYFAYASIDSLSGKVTWAKIFVQIVDDLSTIHKLSIGFGLLGVLYGWWQRHLRKNTIERFAPRTKELEQKIDPKRSSSKLTERGETQPEDKI